MPCPICGAKCVCRKRGEDGRCCSCHKHKARTPQQAAAHAEHDRQRREDGNKFGVEVNETRTDVWWCAKCDREWAVPSLPHNPNCPTCGTSGWWRRFAEPVPA